MLGAFVNAFRTPDLRRKLLFVLGIIVIFRLGSQIPAPGVNVENVQACVAQVESEGIFATIAGRAIYDGTLDFAAAQAEADRLSES